MGRRVWVLAGVLVLSTRPAAGQTVSQSGFAEASGILYPQSASNDDTHAIGAVRLRWEPTVKWTNWHLNASFEARADTHAMTEATATFTDRTTKRPALAVRRLSASWARGPVTVELGKQFVQWGKTDIVIPTNYFGPRDYLEVVTTEELAVTAARVTVGSDVDSIDMVVAPFMTPSRIPLFDQRWVVVPPAAQGLPIVDAGVSYPKRPQVGARWNHIGRRLEYSASFFEGSNHLPQFTGAVVPNPARLAVRRDYAQLTSLGGDAAIPLPWFTLKGEAAWCGSSTPTAEEYVLYVVQLERQVGEWLFIGGYAGDHVTRPGTEFRFAPDRGLARAVVARASYTIDTNRSVTFEGVVRQNGDGAEAHAEYTEALGAHARVTAGFRLIRGSDGDFLGQYRRNSSATLAWRYSF